MKVQIADVVIVDNDKVLLVQQRKQSAHGLWSYPGGHVEEGETHEQAVKREVNEELGVGLTDVKPFKVYPLVTPIGELEIHTFIGNIVGDITLKADELMAYDWFSLESLANMRDKLRAPVVLEQASDVVRGLHSQPKRQSPKNDKMLADMLNIIEQNPGIRPSELNKRLGLAHSAHYRQLLVDRGLVRKERNGVAVRYYPLRKVEL